MPISDRYVHALAIVTPTADAGGAVDAYGQPVPGEPVVTEVRGLIQPKSTREVAQANQAGAGIASHTVFLPRTTIPVQGAYIRFADDGDARYEVVGPPRDFAYGTANDHLEVDCRRVVSDELVAS